MITIIDYGIGNLRSIEKAFQRVGVEVLRTDQPRDLERADRLVLPGVGAFGACINEVRRRGLEAPIKAAVERGTPLLGVCVGMQLMFDVGEEMGEHAGLGLLPGRVVRFKQVPVIVAATHRSPEKDYTDAERPLKVPHMGWNTVTPTQKVSLLSGLSTDSYFYFVHSYHALPDETRDVLATTTYGISFPAIVGRDKVFGVQFHPEKSQHNGLKILENFAKL